jgi:hypothetical protein
LKAVDWAAIAWIHSKHERAVRCGFAGDRPEAVKCGRTKAGVKGRESENEGKTGAHHNIKRKTFSPRKVTKGETGHSTHTDDEGE